VPCFDDATDEYLEVSPTFTSKTFTLIPDSKQAVRIFKNLQHFAFESLDRFKWNGLRSHVEGNNRHLKDDAHSNLGAPDKRRPRGYAFQALAVASAAVVSNMRRIVTFLQGKLDAVVDKATQRARRRRDAQGNRLAHHPGTVALRH